MYAATPETLTAKEREELTLEHLPQVTWIASRIHEKLPSSVQLDDLISAGIVGLLAAIDKFDPTHNASLKTYAEYKIRGAILDSIRGLDGIPSHRRKHVKQVQRQSKLRSNDCIARPPRTRSRPNWESASRNISNGW